MKINMKIKGVQDMKVRLRYTSDTVQKNARAGMHRIADRIIKEAQLNTPVDKYNLEKSIKKVIRYVNKGRLSIDIEVGGFVDGVNVDTYAVQIHENYSSMSPGKGTLAKMKANPGRIVGEKFLTRAMETVRPDINAEILEAIMGGLR